MSSEDIIVLREGSGWGLAKAAELAILQMIRVARCQKDTTLQCGRNTMAVSNEG